MVSTRGKPCAASSEGMEGQDEIETDEVDIIGMKVKAMPRIMMVLWQHIFHEPYSFIFIRPVPPLPLILIFLTFFFFKKNIYNLNCTLLKDRFSKFWTKGMKCGAA